MTRVLLAFGIAAVLLSQAVAADAPTAATALPPLDELNATRERPLFAPTRRPPAPPDQPVAAAPIAEPTNFSYELVGIVLGPQTRIAMFRKGDAKPTDEGAPTAAVTPRKVGDKLDNWTIETIALNYVVLHGDAKRVRLRLYSQKDTGIQIGGAGGAKEPSVDPAADPEHAAVPDPADAEADKNDPIDEEIVPAAPPKVIPPTPRKVVPPPPRGNKPLRPARPPGPNKPRP